MCGLVRCRVCGGGGTCLACVPAPPPPPSRIKSQLSNQHLLLSAPVVAPRSRAYEQVATTATCAARRAPSRVRCDPSRTVSTGGRKRRAELHVEGKGSEKKRTDTQEHECTTKTKKPKREARQHTFPVRFTPFTLLLHRAFLPAAHH